MAYYGIGSGQSSVGIILSGFDDLMEVYDNGTAWDTRINDYASVNVYAGGEVLNTSVNSSSYLHISSGGTALNTMVGPNGYMGVSSGGAASGTTVNSGWLYVDGGYTSGTTVAATGQNAQLGVYSNGIAVSTTVNGKSARMWISSGCTAVATTVIYDAEFEVISGGTAFSTVIDHDGYMKVKGGMADGVSVGSGATLKVKEGGTATNVVWTPTEGELVADGGTITFASAYTGVYLGENDHLLSHAAVMSDVDVTGKTMVVMPGGTADSCTVGQEGCVSVWTGGSVNSLRVSGGELLVFSGGTATNVIWTPTEGCIYLYDGAVVTYARSYSGVYYGFNGKLLSHTDVMTNKTVAGRDMHVFAGGTAIFATIVDEGEIYVYSGGTVTSATVGGSDGELHVGSGGVVVAATVTDDACIDVDSGGFVSSAIIRDSGNLEISRGAVASCTIVYGQFAHFEVDDGSFADNSILFGGHMVVSRGGRADNVTVNQSGWMTVAGGSVNHVTVNSGGQMNVTSGGTATDITVSSGGILDMIVAPDTYAQGASNGVGFFLYNGYISGYKAGPNCYMNVSSGGTADHTTISGISSYDPLLGYDVIAHGMLGVLDGGTADNTIVDSFGLLSIQSGGIASSTVVLTSGEVSVLEGGTAAGTTINPGGHITVFSKGKVTGSLTIHDEAVLFCLSDSILDFDISGRSAGSPVLVNDLTRISGVPDYTITVSATQAAGVYALADGAEYFYTTLSLGTAAKNYGSLTVDGDVLRYRNRDFKLETVDDSLILTVTKKDDVLVTNGKVIRHSDSLDIHTGSSTQSTGSFDRNNWSLLGSGSFAGGGTAGLLWQETATGNVYMQNDAEDVSDLTAKSNLLGTVTEGYEIGGIGDFFGTGRDGALLLTPSFGDSSISMNYGLAVWAREKSGDTVNGWLGALVNTWDEVDGMNQLKGDYQTLVGEGRNQLINFLNYRYELVGTADFDGDGKTDVMLRNNMPGIVDGETITGSGDVFVFLTDSHDNVVAGIRPDEGIRYTGCATGGWNVVGFGDFNGDGIDDVLLSDGSNLAGWQIQSGQRIGDYWFGPLGDWTFAGVGDFTGDGTADILVSQGNEYSVWKVKNGTVTGSIAIA